VDGDGQIAWPDVTLTFVVTRASLVAAAGYAGYQFGSWINQNIENAYGQNAGMALYEILHGESEEAMFRFKPTCRP